MKKKQLNWDDIEEVDSHRPRRRMRNNQEHNNINNINNDHPYNYSDNNRLTINNESQVQISGIDYEIPYNNNNSNSHSHGNHGNHGNHRHRRRRMKMMKFGCIQIILMTIFLMSIGVLILSFLTNLVLTINQVMTPKIFMPSIILIFLSFLFSASVLGSYIAPMEHNQFRIKYKEILLTRSMAPIIMFIISFIFILGGDNNVKNLKNELTRSQNICEENKGMSMEEIYIKANETLDKYINEKNKLIYSFNNKLICFPIPRCVRLNSESNKYICNSQDFIINNDETSKIKCDILNNDNNSMNIIDNLKPEKDANIFLENCFNLNINFLVEKNNIIQCVSDMNLEKINFNKNITLKSDKNIGIYLNQNLKKINDKIQQKKQIIKKYETSNYNYDLECLKEADYKLSYLMLNIYNFLFYFFCVFWILFGIYSMNYLIKLGKSGEINFSLNDLNNEEASNAQNVNNNLSEEGEDNKLIIEDK